MFFVLFPFSSNSANSVQSIASISIAAKSELYPTAPVSPSLLPVTLSSAQLQIKIPT